MACPHGDVWCVFDRETFSESNSARALELARAERLGVGWSNEAFEEKSRPERNNPSTRVHKLVEFLNELANLGPT
jgi:hypothetical protein